MVNIDGRAMSIPGVNYHCKPYVDVGDPLPSIGERVRSLTDTTIEGVVIALDGRRIRIKGFISAIRGGQAYTHEDAASAYWTHEDFEGWVPWQDFEVTIENGEAASRARAGIG